jgi:hypothetical protein
MDGVPVVRAGFSKPTVALIGSRSFAGFELVGKKLSDGFSKLRRRKASGAQLAIVSAERLGRKIAMRKRRPKCEIFLPR